ncbi:MAG: methylcobamide--CoM methyltransferase, partial [Synergistaceae bacterium]|nr:methylcobamide--CoM methyltransferase [Synergistaceae bacterium]
MTSMGPRERLLRAAKGEETDRPPCICPGGMMNAIIRDIMEETGCPWPESHSDPRKMADLTLALYRAGGFENCGVPFCMTVEAEAMGAKVDMGDMETEPHVVDSPLSSTEEV